MKDSLKYVWDLLTCKNVPPFIAQFERAIYFVNLVLSAILVLMNLNGIGGGAMVAVVPVLLFIFSLVFNKHKAFHILSFLCRTAERTKFEPLQ